jgi:iron(III) transport system permease protein
LAVGTAALCVPIAWVIASLARRRPRLGTAIDLMSLFLFLIPGPIVGLVVVRSFTLPVPGFYSLYHQTLLPTIVALMVRALPVSYWILRAGYTGLDSSILDLSRTDLSWIRGLWLIDRPLLTGPLLFAGFASAVMASGDVPVTLPVLPPGIVTVGTRLFALLHSGARNQEAALAFWYVCSVVLFSVALSFRWKRSVE